MRSGWRGHRLELALGLALAAATCLAYAQVMRHDFVSLDDPQYVTENRHVQAGLRAESVRWALSSLEHANWHPLTWLSLELDCSLYGVNPAGYHATNLILHVANTLLLFWWLLSLTGAVWRGAVVAALFALHPLHVESVAWVAERKDVLSTLFWLLTLLAYAHYARRPCAGRYWVVTILFGIGLTAKPMLVTLPCVLLLLDYWPLGRWPGKEKGEMRKGTRFQPAHGRRLIAEKLPLLVLSAASCVITFIAQSGGGAVLPVDRMPLASRLLNALVAYIAYLEKAVFPLELAVYYPLRAPAPAVATVAGALLLGATYWVCRRARRQPYLAVGWFWYLGTLVPVIGIVQVGTQAIADRYTYVPLIGIFIASVWGVADLQRSEFVSRKLTVALATAALGAFGVCTWLQVGYWRDSVRLWAQAHEVAGPNATATGALGSALAERGHAAEGLPYLDDALRLAPDDAKLHTHMALALLRLGRRERGLAEFEAAVRLDPNDARSRYNLGLMLELLDRPDDALTQYEAAIRLEPEHAQAHRAQSRVLADQFRRGAGMEPGGERHGGRSL
ncbi:MAG TPA: tetratricopeptide repeat protein [Pirellulales bacterium]|nr:tetratricopeptide repeat protein [Pirellulales bacterium]